MKHQVNMRDVNHHLARYISAVQEGDEIIIMKHGEPVACIVPFKKSKKLNSKQKAALVRTRKRMNAGYHLGGRFDRETIYERK